MRNGSNIEKSVVRKVNPIAVQLEITDRCNMHCPMCISSDHCDNPLVKTLTTDEIVDKVLLPLKERGVHSLSLSGGEPTISPYLIDVMIEAKKLGFGLFLATNALSERMHSFASVFDALAGAPSAAIQISFDSKYPEEMNEIRGGDYFEVVTKNLSTLVAMSKETNGEVRLVCVVVVQEANASSFVDTVQYLLDMGVERVTVQLRHDYSEIDASNWAIQPPLLLSDAAKNAILLHARVLFEKARLDAKISVVGGSWENWEAFLRQPTEMKVKCNAMKRVFVDPYGNLRGCIHSKIIGSLDETGINEFLDSDAYADFLRFASVCNICIHGCAR